MSKKARSVLAPHVDTLQRRHRRAVAAAIPPASDLLLDTQHLLAGVEGLDAIFEAITLGARRLGFERCAYGLRIKVPFTRPETIIISNYDARWQQRYRDANYLDTDPTVAHGARSGEPIIWSDDVFKHTPQLWSEARDCGLRVGWAQSCFGAKGMVGMLSLVRSHEALSSAEIAQHDPFLRCLANIAHLALSAGFARDHPAWHPKLTAREIEVLQWTADGKNTEDVAQLLHISVNTVKFHIKNVIEKLDVPNKPAAVARATALGFLD